MQQRTEMIFLMKGERAGITLIFKPPFTASSKGSGSSAALLVCYWEGWQASSRALSIVEFHGPLMWWLEGKGKWKGNEVD